MPDKPAAIIIGGTGFAGLHLAARLSDRYRVVNTGRGCDIRDKEALARLIGAHPSAAAVVNLAALTTVRETVENPKAAYDTAFYGLLNLFEALQNASFDGRFLQVSSSEIYGFPKAEDLPLTETSPLRPMSPYSVAKIAADMLCYEWAQRAAFSICVARPFTHIGPGQSDRFAVARFAKQIMGIVRDGLPPRITVGNLSATRDLTDVRDVARAYDLILHQGTSGEVYNVCSGREVNMRFVLNELIRLSAHAIEAVEEQNLTRSAEQQRLRGSFDKLHLATGWSPEIPLEQTLRDTLGAHGAAPAVANPAANAIQR